jgi:hypothetical protein
MIIISLDGYWAPSLYTRLLMKKQWDKWGIVLSTACIIHCFAVVILPLMLPAVEMFVHSPWVHRVFAVLVITTTPLAFIPGYRRHGLPHVLFSAVAGLVLILSGVFLDGRINEVLSHGVSILGSILLVSAHILNIRYSRRFHPVVHKHSHTKNCC